MRKISSTKSKKYKEFKKSKISYNYDKTLSLFSICEMCGSEGEKLFIEEKKSKKYKKFLA